MRAPERGELALESGQLVHLLQAADIGAPVRHLRQQPPAAVAPVQAPARRRAVQLMRMLLCLPKAWTILTTELWQSPVLVKTERPYSRLLSQAQHCTD